MKNIIRFVIFATTVFASITAFTARAPAVEDRHAVEISIGSNGTEFDMAAYRILRRTIGSAVANSVIDKFIIYGYGIEGGFSGCVEGSPSIAAPSRDFETFVKRLKAIQPEELSTPYSVQRIKTCPSFPVVEPKPATLQVAKPDGSISCNPNSGTSLTDMQKELGAITVYSALKLSDGLIRPAVCSIETGEHNVYEIAETDFEQVVALGFTAWSDIVTLPANQSSLTPLKRVCSRWVTVDGDRRKITYPC